MSTAPRTQAGPFAPWETGLKLAGFDEMPSALQTDFPDVQRTSAGEEPRLEDRNGPMAIRAPTKVVSARAPDSDEFAPHFGTVLGGKQCKHSLKCALCRFGVACKKA